MKQINIKSAVSGAAQNRNTRRRQTDNSVFFTPAQLADRWAWHCESVRRMVRRGTVEAVILGRRVLIPITEIERIENEGRVVRAVA